MSQPPARALGKQKAVFSARVPRLSAIAAAATPPAMVNWYAAIDRWPILANDQLGDCVEAGALHCLQQRYTYAAKPFQLGDTDAIALYRSWAGYDPAQPGSDQGTIMLNGLRAWLRDGIPFAGGVDKLVAFAAIERASVDWVKYAIWKFGGALIGLHCPEAFLQSDYLLDIPATGPGPIAGGHCVYLCGYLPTALGDEFDCITWGGRFRITGRALAVLMDEGYAILDRDWCDGQGIDPGGVNFALAQAAMANFAALA